MRIPQSVFIDILNGQTNYSSETKCFLEKHFYRVMDYLATPNVPYETLYGIKSLDDLLVYDPNIRLGVASAAGNLPLVKEIIKHGAGDVKSAMCYACLQNQPILVDYFFQKFGSNSFFVAYYIRHEWLFNNWLELVKVFIKHQPDTIDWFMEMCIRYSHSVIVEYLLQIRSFDYSRLLGEAINGHVHFSRCLAEPDKRGLTTAAKIEEMTKMKDQAEKIIELLKVKVNLGDSPEKEITADAPENQI